MEDGMEIKLSSAVGGNFVFPMDESAIPWRRTFAGSSL